MGEGVACPFRTRTVLYRMLAVVTVHEMFHTLSIYYANLSKIAHIPGMFQPLEFLWEYRMELVAMELLSCFVTVT